MQKLPAAAAAFLWALSQPGFAEIPTTNQEIISCSDQLATKVRVQKRNGGWVADEIRGDTWKLLPALCLDPSADPTDPDVYDLVFQGNFADLSTHRGREVMCDSGRVRLKVEASVNNRWRNREIEAEAVRLFPVLCNSFPPPLANTTFSTTNGDVLDCEQPIRANVSYKFSGSWYSRQVETPAYRLVPQLCGGVSVALPETQCTDGIDNDGDGLIDMEDNGCTSAGDDDEYTPPAECADGADNDNDGLVDLLDPGCANAADDDEFDSPPPNPECSDALDNDGDGLVDLSDPGCTGVDDNSEFNQPPPDPACSDGADNDGDGLIDLNDPGCSSSSDDDEYNALPPQAECADQMDNDGDGLTDLDDPGCDSPSDNNEFDGTSGASVSFQTVSVPSAGVGSSGWFGIYLYRSDGQSYLAMTDHSSRGTDPRWRWTGSAWTADAQVGELNGIRHGWVTNATQPQGSANRYPVSGDHGLSSGNNDLIHFASGTGAGRALCAEGHWEGQQCRAFGDITGDGIDDVLRSDGTVWDGSTISTNHIDSSGYQVARGTVIGSGIPMFQSSMYTKLAVLADFDGDGQGEALTDEGLFNLNGQLLATLPVQGFIIGGAAAGDFDGDDDLDVVVVEGGDDYVAGGTTKLLENRNGTFVSVPIGGLAPQGGSQRRYNYSMVADFNNDGCDDIVMTSNGKVYQSNCDLTFLLVQTFPVSDRMPVTSVGDFNNDGLTDFCATPASYSGSPHCYRNTSDGAPPPTSQCDDGLDNDGDGFIDLDDPGCENAEDDDEADSPPPAAQCDDGLDNDGDGFIDLNDPGCENSDDDDETNGPPPVAQCDDGVDNDGDGFIDLADPGCSSSEDDNEQDPIDPGVTQSRLAYMAEQLTWYMDQPYDAVNTWLYDRVQVLYQYYLTTGDESVRAEAKASAEEYIQHYSFTGDPGWPDCAGGWSSAGVNVCDYKFTYLSALYFLETVEGQTGLYSAQQLQQFEENTMKMGWGLPLLGQFCTSSACITERWLGFGLQNLTYLHRLGHPSAIDRIGEVLDWILSIQDPDVGAIMHSWKAHEGSTAGSPGDCQGFSPWQTAGQLVPGLAAAHRATGDPRAAEALRGFGRAILNHGIFTNPPSWSHSLNQTDYMVWYFACPSDTDAQNQLQESQGWYADLHLPEVQAALSYAREVETDPGLIAQYDQVISDLDAFYTSAMASVKNPPRLFGWQHSGAFY